MITITKNFEFTANDFFSYLEQQLITAIKQARNNNMPVVLKSGTKYKQGDIDTEITKYERGKIYEADFRNSRLHIVISYQTEDTADGVTITFSEDIKSYDESSHNWLSNLLYNMQLKHGARKELNKMADGVRQHISLE